MDTINIRGNEFLVNENSIYYDSNGGQHPLQIISRSEIFIIRVGQQHITISQPQDADGVWCVVQSNKPVDYFIDGDEANACVFRWIDAAFDALPE